MKPIHRTLLAIFTFIALTLGSFIWFIATWDPSKEEPVALGVSFEFEVSQA